MKIFYGLILIAISAISLQAQQISLGEISRLAKFNKLIDEVNNGTQKIKYSEIEGIPYSNINFVRAKVGESTTWVPIRYNSFLDTVEILVNTDVFEIPRAEAPPRFTFEKTNEKLVVVHSQDEYAGYFFEIADGKNRILKKIITKFYDASPAPNSLIPGTPARFETQKPLYFIKTESGLIKIPKTNKDMLVYFPEKKNELNSFLKTTKIKLNHEPDLVKLAEFLNN